MHSLHFEERFEQAEELSGFPHLLADVQVGQRELCILLEVVPSEELREVLHDFHYFVSALVRVRELHKDVNQLGEALGHFYFLQIKFRAAFASQENSAHNLKPVSARWMRESNFFLPQICLAQGMLQAGSQQ